MKLTEVDYYYNTPFDLENTIHFKSNEERDTFFSGDVYNKYSYEEPRRFNFIRDKMRLRTTLTTAQVNGLNYLRFRNQFDDDHWFYCFVEHTEFVNDHVTELYLVPDVVMTYLQGNFTDNLNGVFVNRMSATEDEWKRDKLFLGTNDDVLALPKQYTHKDLDWWEYLCVVFTTSVDLKSDFGTENDPKLTTSKGQIHDGVTSPTDIYVAVDLEKFNKFTEKLSDFPWIAQNINNVALIPTSVVDDDDLKDIEAKNDFVSENLSQFKNKTKTASVVAEALGADKTTLKENFGLENYIPDFVFRHGYTNLQLTDWAGQEIDIDPVLLPNYELKVIEQVSLGYHNEVDVFPDRYNDGGENSINGLYRGSYKDNAIIFKDFDSIPVLIDNYKLGKAQTAHQRQVANSNTFTGRVNRVLDNSNSLEDRLMSALSLTSSVTSLSGISGGLTSSYDYYRNLRAQYQDMAISAPTVDQQATGNSFAIAHNHYGVTAHYQSISYDDAMKVIRYHALFGFDYKGLQRAVNPIQNSRTVAYYNITGAYNIPNMPSQYLAQLKVQFENGLRFWINNGSERPMNDVDPTSEFI